MKTRTALFPLALALLVFGCKEMRQGLKSSEQAVANFHKLYDEGKPAEIYADGHAKFKSAAKEKEFVDFLAGVRRQLGKVTHTSETNFYVNTTNYNFNSQTTVKLIQDTTFERGRVAETFEFELNGDKAQLVRYRIASKDLK
jgi:hypothetical protein